MGGKKGNGNAKIKNDDPHLPNLLHHLYYLEKLGKVRATRVVATSVDDRYLANYLSAASEGGVEAVDGGIESAATQLNGKGTASTLPGAHCIGGV